MYLCFLGLQSLLYGSTYISKCLAKIPTLSPGPVTRDACGCASIPQVSSTISLCLFSISVPTNILFTNTVTFPSFIKSLRILFIIVWNIASEFIILKNITVGLKEPICVINTPFYLFPSLILTLLNPYYHKWSLTICDGCFDTLNSSKMRSQTSDKRCC